MFHEVRHTWDREHTLLKQLEDSRILYVFLSYNLCFTVVTNKVLLSLA